MKIAVLTSSRADFGIYLPLLKAMTNDPFFDVRIIAFGTHLSLFHGYTIDGIAAEGFQIDHCVENVLASDTPESIATSMALTSMKFVSIWQKERHNYDLVFCLGDRYEMFAAVSASVPFIIMFAHIHGGETTLGAIDNKFRHCLSNFSSIHFVTTEEYAQKVMDITGNDQNVHTVGALSLDNLKDIALLSQNDFFEKYEIDVGKPTILVTFHSETVTSEDNISRVNELVSALNKFTDYQVIITMPNADTMGNAMRNVYKNFAAERSNVYLVENFGTLGYFSCMQHCKVIVGNSSSGIIEAANFRKYVVDIGDRQKGRMTSGNVIHCNADADLISSAINEALKKGDYTQGNIYDKGGAAMKIIEVLKKWKR